MIKILCIADAPGPAEMMLPVLSLLKNNAEVLVLAYGKAFEVLASSGAKEIKTVEEAVTEFENFKPDILVDAISSLTTGPYIQNTLIKKASDENVKVVCLQDIWGNHRWKHNEPSLKFSNLVCTLDEFGASLWREDNFKGEVVATGNPAFEKFKDVNVMKEGASTRARLGLSDSDKIIFYVGQGTPRAIEEDKKTFKLLTESLKLITDFPTKLIFRPHPRAEETSYYKEYSDGLNVVDTTKIHFSESLLPVADLVVSIFATNLIHACYLRLPAMSIILPGAGSEITDILRLKDFPPNTMGATVGFYENNPEALKELIRKILTDENFQKSIHTAQEKNFILDSKSAERVAEAILNSPPKL